MRESWWDSRIKRRHYYRAHQVEWAVRAALKAGVSDCVELNWWVNGLLQRSATNNVIMHALKKVDPKAWEHARY